MKINPYETHFRDEKKNLINLYPSPLVYKNILNFYKALNNMYSLQNEILHWQILVDFLMFRFFDFHANK